MKRRQRSQPLTQEEAARYDDIRAKVAGELPELIRRHTRRKRNVWKTLHFDNAGDAANFVSALSSAVSQKRTIERSLNMVDTDAPWSNIRAAARFADVRIRDYSIGPVKDWGLEE